MLTSVFWKIAKPKSVNATWSNADHKGDSSGNDDGCDDKIEIVCFTHFTTIL